MIIDSVSDLHGNYPKLEGGDLLIVAGDLTKNDDAAEHFAMWDYLSRQNYKKIIIVAGNHDEFIKSNEGNEFINNWNCITYLCDSGTEFEGLKIWGSPWTLRFPGMNPKAMAFTVDTEEELAEKWALIPDDTDILVTHCPPKDVLDELMEEGYHAGSVALENVVKRIRPRLHVFGHIHEAYGKDFYQFERFCGTGEIVFVNASHVNERYEPVNKPIRIEL